MKKLFLSLVLVLIICSYAISQTPQYYNANSGGIGNSLPFNNAAGYKTQWLIGPGEYNQPTSAPPGIITKFYIYCSSAGSATYSTFTIKMGQAAITSFPTGEYTGTLDSVFGRASYSITSAANSYIVFNLDAPFTYNPAQSLIIQVYHCGITSGTGFSIWQISGTTGIFRRNNIPGNTSCIFAYSGQDTRIVQSGIDVVSGPAAIVNRSMLLPTPGVNTNYVAIPNGAGMTGFQTITIEAWVKIGGSTTANTVLNKGGSSFDYQLGIIATTRTPFFRGPSQQATSTYAIPVGEWTHLAVTSNGTQAVFYMNGVPQTISSPVTLGTSSNEMRIGRGNADAGSGKIDELRLWNVVRTPAEILANMCVKWIPNSTTGLKGKWHMDSTFVDSVSGWNGTAVGNVGFDTAMNCVVTGIKNVQTEIPQDFQLYQNYPNPFNPVTTIKFTIPKSSYVEMKLYDINGREVTTLVSDPYQAGTYLIDFNASHLSSGVYFYKIVAGDFTATKKMLLIK